MEQDMTKGNVIWRQILLFFLPLLGASFFQLLYNTVDTIIVGRFIGKTALAAVGGTSGQICIMVTDFLIGFSTGATVLISQAFGARNRKLLEDGVRNAVAISVITGALFMASGLLLSRAALTAAGVPADTFASSLLYLQVISCGMIPNAVFNMGAAILRAVGDSGRPMRYLATCSVLNILLDFLFVAVLRLGIGGAAFATILSQFISAGLIMRSLMSKEVREKIGRLQGLHLQPAVAGRMLQIGIPLGFEELMYTFSCVILTTAVNTFGTDTVAAYAGFVRIETFYWMLEASFAVSITTFVGQNLGAGLMDRVHSGVRQGAALMFLVMGTAVVLMYSGCRLLLGLFTTDPGVLEIGVDMMRFLLPFYIVYIPSGVFFAALRGMGDSFRPFLITFSGVCVLRMIWVMLVFPHYPTIRFLLLCFPVSWVTTNIVYALYYRHFLKTRAFDRPL